MQVWPVQAIHCQPALDALTVNDDWAVHAVELLLARTAALGGSDLHLLCRREGIDIRARCEGDLLPLARVDRARRDLLLGRLKVLARLAVFIRHEPQDGRIDWNPPGGGEPRPLRISFLPTLHGENVVIRFPEQRAELELEALGMPPDVLREVGALLAQPEGTLLITGPSSSGKTTTLYAMLRALARAEGERLNFITIEDPAECDLGFAGQVQVDEAKGLTFERALRAALRQDPNVLLIGEIRDPETARTALQAGMTGHLVLSTVHAGRAGLVFPRLLSMGISRYLVATALSGVMAQRLVRRLCPQCKAEHAPGGWHAPGCVACHQSGHGGRTGLFELVRVTESLRACIMGEVDPTRLASAAAEAQSGGLLEQARELARSGVISAKEFAWLFPQEDVAAAPRASASGGNGHG